jgi:hypothetical protein
MNLFASHPSVYTLPGTWEPQPDVLYTSTFLGAVASVTFVIFIITLIVFSRRKRKRV